MASKISVALLAMAGLLSASASAFAREVYTWTDENGVVHYTDRAPDHPDARSMNAPEAYRPGSVAVDLPQPAAPAAPAPPEGTGKAEEEPLSPADAKRQELAERRAERRRQQAENDAICNRARQQLAAVEPARRVFYENEQGETVRMDDDERMRLVDENKALIEKYCR